MGRSFNIFNIDKGLGTGFCRWVDLFLDGKAATLTAGRISSKGNVDFPKDPLEGQPYIQLRKRRSSKIGICDLPFELQDAIFALLRDPIDVMAFCLTASHFWRMGLPHFKALYTRHVLFRAWDGDRLICMGDRTDGCPDGLLTESELQKLKASYCLHYTDSEDATISDILTECSRSPRDVQWPHYLDFTYRCRLTTWTWDTRHRTHATSASSSDSDDDLPTDRALYKYDFSAWFERWPILKRHDAEKPCVLRNLSKHVYVRDDALAATEDDSFVCGMSLGDVLVLRILWADDLRISTTQSDDAYHGIWAGDRFDIVNIDAIENDEGWTDDSTAAFAELRDVWQEQYGEGWVEEVYRVRG